MRAILRTHEWENPRAMAMLQAVKAKSFEKKNLLTADEFRAIADSVLKKAAATT